MLDHVRNFLSRAFGGDTPHHELEMYQVALRATVLYVFGMLLVRAGKGRLIGKITPVDIVVAFILGSILSRGITGSASLTETVTAASVLVGLHWLFTLLAWRSHRIGTLLKGNPHLLVRDGRIIEDAMRGSHISEHDLYSAMRLAGLEDLQDVKSAYKERNGEISIIPRRPHRDG